MNQTHRIASLVLLAGLTSGAHAQPYHQGTIERERPRLDDVSIAPATDGWLSDETTPKFWAWELGGTINDTQKHPAMQRWIYHWFWTSSTAGGAPNTTSLDSQATSIANQIVAGYNSGSVVDGEYALCLLGAAARIDMFDTASDSLDDSVLLHNPATGTCDQWSTFMGSTESDIRASPWRADGTALAEACLSYLTTEIVSRVLAHPSFPASTPFPAPARIFFDEERGRQHGTSSFDNLAEMEALLTDARWNTQALYGNFDLWDATPGTTYASEVFTSSPMVDISGWNAACTAYTPHVPTNAYTAAPWHQNPSFDHEFMPIYIQYNGILTSAIEGAIGATLSGTRSDPDWGDFKWSNYNTSAWFSPNYPRISGAENGALHPAWIPHEHYGWGQNYFLGSADMQSPNLYPPNDFHQTDVGDENGTNFVETPAEAWLRYSRHELDHILFSFGALDDLEIDAPRHITPWLTRVGTIVYIPDDGNSTTITTKPTVRDIVALCKAKGVNELIFWGNPGAESYGQLCGGGASSAQVNWDSTNDLLSQVWEYSLVGASTDRGSLTSDAVESMRFSEEHTLDMEAIQVGSDLQVLIRPTFSIGTLSTLGESYSFICETLDGGGPWDGANYTLKIYNYDTASYETITQASTELFSTSTRRAEFSDTDSDGYSNEWERVFDDEADLPSGSFVTDRKTIQRWDIALPIGAASLADYTSGGQMRFEVVATHDQLPDESHKPDPLRIDLFQLYETECVNDNIPAEEQRLAGDLNDDGAVTGADLALFKDSGDIADINGDGAVDSTDMQELLRLILSN